MRAELCGRYGDIMQTQPQAQSWLSRKVGVDEEGAAQEGMNGRPKAVPLTLLNGNYTGAH